MQEHNEWITYAENDLKAAEHLLASSDGSVILPALYMTQQCAEKALKAFLIYKGVNPGKNSRSSRSS